MENVKMHTMDEYAHIRQNNTQVLQPIANGSQTAQNFHYVLAYTKSETERECVRSQALYGSH